MPTSELRSHLLAILAADVAGYSRLMSLDELATVAALDAARTVFREQIALHGGRVIDMAGDSVLSVFETATGAMNAALAVQRQLDASAINVPADRRLRFRIGVHVGDVIEKIDGTVYGDGVNIAARLEGLAEHGAIAVSQAMYGMVVQRVDAVFEDIGDQMVKNIAQPVRVFQARLRLPGEAAQSPALSLTRTRVGNIPEVLPTLIGRADDLTCLVALVGAHRVVSIVGAGGIGKTRLAQVTAHALRHEFAGGAWMVELAPVADPALLPAAVAQVLGVILPGKRSAQDEVIDALRDRAVLLVLDNCEHLLGAASAFAHALVDRAPQAHLLITSQELIKVADEHLYRVAPLSLPTTSDLTTVQASGAVALLVNRVQALQPTFALTEHNAADVADICCRLDGLPLAIELAAARVPLLGATGVRERLYERFRVLTGGARTALRRHQTLREALDWSHGLLDADERAVFRRAGVFAGSFTMTAAQQVLGDGRIDVWAVLEHLGALVDKSLVVAEPVEPPRYRLLESARAYALEKLLDAGETEVTLERHAQTVLAFFEAGLEERWTVPRTVRVETHLPDLDNLRVALDWAARGPAALHIALAGASAWIWVGTGQRAEGLRRCDQALVRIDANTPPALEARLQAQWCVLPASPAGSTERAAAERAITLYRGLGDRRNLYLALEGLAITSARSGNFELIERASLEMAQLHDAGWPPASRWHMLNARGAFLSTSDQHEEAHGVAEVCLRLATAVGDSVLIHTALMYLAQSASNRGRFEEAVARGRELALLIRGERFSGSLAIVLGNLSAALTELGQLDEALATGREAAPLYAQTGTPLWIWLVPFALLAYKRGRMSEATLAFGRADAKHNWSIPHERRARDELLGLLQRALPSAELKRLMAEGAALTDEEAARIALAL